MLSLPAIYCEIVLKDLHEPLDIFPEYFHDDALQSRRSRFQYEHHDYCDEHSPFCDKSRLLLIGRMHPNLIVAAKSI